MKFQQNPIDSRSGNNYFFKDRPSDNFLFRQHFKFRTKRSLFPSILILPLILFFPFLIPAAPIKVVIDPGHGGKDRGAVYADIEEKRLNLSMTTHLEALLSRHKEFETHLTRSEDRNVSIRQRIDLINRIKPDFFISIHFNSQPFLTSTRGMEIYYPGDDFTLPAVEFLPEFHRNNRAFILASLFKKRYFEANLHSTWNLPLNRIIGKELAILTDSEVPGILIEVAYITSPEDRACIENDKFLTDFVYYIYYAILSISKDNLLKK